MKIAIVGGTGREGKGLTLRWARAGHAVSIGSRDAEKAKARAEELRGETGLPITGDGNDVVTKDADVVVLSVPYGAHADTLRSIAPALAGKILIDITVPLKPPKVGEVNLPAGNAAALEAQAIVGAEVKLVAGLHHLSSVHLGDTEHKLEDDVLLCSDHPEALEAVTGLIQDLGARALDAGPLKNAVALESMTPVLLYMGKKYKSPGLGLHVTGLK